MDLAKISIEKLQWCDLFSFKNELNVAKEINNEEYPISKIKLRTEEILSLFYYQLFNNYQSGNNFELL